MGLDEIFSNNADLNGLLESDQLLKVFVIHQAFIEINEEGSEAATATGKIFNLNLEFPIN